MNYQNKSELVFNECEECGKELNEMEKEYCTKKMTEKISYYCSICSACLDKEHGGKWPLFQKIKVNRHY